jgi:exodeoxyribonuclease VII small subunit
MGKEHAQDLDTAAYEKLIEELDGVVQRLEAGDLPLEESLRAFERGVRLAQAAERQLDRAEHRVEVLLQEGRRQALEPMEQAPQPGTPEDEDIPF